LLSLLVLVLVSCQAPRPTNLGVFEVEGKKILQKCPESPNCINSHFPEDKDHYLAPLKFQMEKEAARKLLLEVIKRDKSAKIITNDENYIHAEYTSSLLKFVDDVEFNLSDEGQIHFRSASRSGYSDLGVNKKRMSQISFYFYQNNM
ncbi:unnamed protein product, partial [Chrysoparadoxa australica]